ncbi:hypothetical protein R1sor_013318 [Riccia sorocarpa]|uniref:Reverse transcriptase domain-containing protein n=1 Tax=Riccia sorocarpa TaxID=122646 RepID=A0ABD3HA43_9MARC
MKIGEQLISMLLFADYVAMIGSSEDQLRFHLGKLEEFCALSGLNVNLSKTKWSRVGGRPDTQFMFQSQPVMEFYTEHQFWGPSIPKSAWRKIERIQKNFLREELGVRRQIPYVILLAESGRISLEVEALIVTIQYVTRVKASPQNYAYHVLQISRSRGWFADVCAWAALWDFAEHFWGEMGTVRERLTQVENKYHVFMICPHYVSIREEYNIQTQDLRDFFMLPLEKLGNYIASVDALVRQH